MADLQIFHVGHGDTVQTSYIAKTLEAKLYARPGVTVNDEIKIPNAETILYWTRAHSLGNDSTKKPGAPQEFTAKALNRQTVLVDKAEQLSGVIPGVNIATVAADTVNAYVVDGTIEAANRINRDYIKVLCGVNSEGVASLTATATAGSDVYDKILDLRATFVAENGKEVEGKVPSYIEPTAMFVSPKVMSALKKQNLILFKDNSPYGSFLEMEIIECPNLPSTLDVVMINKLAMVSGVAFNAVKTFDASPLGYADGVAYIGELAYANAKTVFDEFTVIKPIYGAKVL